MALLGVLFALCVCSLWSITGLYVIGIKIGIHTGDMFGFVKIGIDTGDAFAFITFMYGWVAHYVAVLVYSAWLTVRSYQNTPPQNTPPQAPAQNTPPQNPVDVWIYPEGKVVHLRDECQGAGAQSLRVPPPLQPLLPYMKVCKTCLKSRRLA